MVQASPVRGTSPDQNEPLGPVKDVSTASDGTNVSNSCFEENFEKNLEDFEKELNGGDLMSGGDSMQNESDSDYSSSHEQKDGCYEIAKANLDSSE